MTQSIPVQCLIDRSWNHSTKEWDGETVTGTLIDFSTEAADGNFGKLVPVGIVVLANSKLQSIPVEFITKI